MARSCGKTDTSRPLSDVAACGNDQGYLGKYLPPERAALHAFLMGTHPVVGRSSPIRSLPVCIIPKALLPFFRKSWLPRFFHISDPHQIITLVLVVKEEFYLRLFCLVTPQLVWNQTFLVSQLSGKTSCISRYLDNKFPTGYKPTIGADFLSTHRTVGDQEVGLQIWDTAGQVIPSI